MFFSYNAVIVLIDPFQLSKIFFNNSFLFIINWFRSGIQYWLCFVYFISMTSQSLYLVTYQWYNNMNLIASLKVVSIKGSTSTTWSSFIVIILFIICAWYFVTHRRYPYTIVCINISVGVSADIVLNIGVEYYPGIGVDIEDDEYHQAPFCVHGWTTHISFS